MTLTFLILLPLIGLVGLGLALVLLRQLGSWQPPDEPFASLSLEIRKSLLIFLTRGALVLVVFLFLTLLVLSRWASSGTTASFIGGALVSVSVVLVSALVTSRTVGVTVSAAGRSGSEAATDVAFSGVSGMVLETITPSMSDSAMRPIAGPERTA